MSTQSSYSIGGVDKSPLLWLRLIEVVEDGVYRVELMSKDGSTLSTISRVSDVDVGGGEVIQSINFDSEEYGRLMMRGLILSQPICHAIGAFHKALFQSRARPEQS
jgi:hypothetical protein